MSRPLQLLSLVPLIAVAACADDEGERAERVVLVPIEDNGNEDEEQPDETDSSSEADDDATTTTTVAPSPSLLVVLCDGDLNNRFGIRMLDVETGDVVEERPGLTQEEFGEVSSDFLFSEGNTCAQQHWDPTFTYIAGPYHGANGEQVGVITVRNRAIVILGPPAVDDTEFGAQQQIGLDAVFEPGAPPARASWLGFDPATEALFVHRFDDTEVVVRQGPIDGALFIEDDNPSRVLVHGRYGAADFTLTLEGGNPGGRTDVELPPLPDSDYHQGGPVAVTEDGSLFAFTACDDSDCFVWLMPPGGEPRQLAPVDSEFVAGFVQGGD